MDEHQVRIERAQAHSCHLVSVIRIITASVMWTRLVGITKDTWGYRIITFTFTVLSKNPGVGIIQHTVESYGRSFKDFTHILGNRALRYITQLRQHGRAHINPYKRPAHLLYKMTNWKLVLELNPNWNIRSLMGKNLTQLNVSWNRGYNELKPFIQLLLANLDKHRKS